MACPTCRDRKLVCISLKVAEQALTLRSCSHCETQWWEADGRKVELGNVLDVAKA